MIRMLFSLILVFTVVLPVEASEIVAPEVPNSGLQNMPNNTSSFGEALLDLVRNAGKKLRPDLQEAAQICSAIVFTGMLVSLLQVFGSRLNGISEIAGAAAISGMMLQHTNSMIYLASDTVTEVSEYGKLLCQVMTAALSAQGGVTTSSTLYIGTMVFLTLLGSLISRIVLPMIYCFLAFAIAYCGLGDELLKKAADTIKGILSWLLKTLMIVFTTYMSITGAVSGTSDLALLKSTKVIISTTVPVIGGILADSSEAVLASISLAKNAAGIYGILAVLAVFIGPFMKIGSHYVMLKLSAWLSSIFGNNRIADLADYFSSAMSLLLASVAASSSLVLISTICFLKGAI